MLTVRKDSTTTGFNRIRGQERAITFTYSGVWLILIIYYKLCFRSQWEGTLLKQVSWEQFLSYICNYKMNIHVQINVYDKYNFVSSNLFCKTTPDYYDLTPSYQFLPSLQILMITFQLQKSVTVFRPENCKVVYVERNSLQSTYLVFRSEDDYRFLRLKHAH